MREEVDPNKADNGGETQISHTPSNEQAEVAIMLPALAEVNPNRPDYDDQISLSPAAGEGREGVVKIPPGQEDANPDQPNNLSSTTLAVVSSRGRDSEVARPQSPKAVTLAPFEVEEIPTRRNRRYCFLFTACCSRKSS